MRYAALFIFCILMVGCATTNLPSMSTGKFDIEQDEKRLWNRATEEEEALEKSGIVYKDESLEKYLNEIAGKLQPPETSKHLTLRIRVIKNPYLNAFAFPHGVIYVHTGILARMDNEAQLATLLAHEMTHSTHRHAVRGFRSDKNKSATLSSLQVTFGGLPVVGVLVSTLGQIGAMAAVSGYSKDLETEADTEGLKLMVKAGYDPNEAPKLFAHMVDELKEENIKEPFFYGTHPKLKDRIGNYERLLKSQYQNQKGATNKDIFQKNALGAMFANADLDLKAGRFSIAKRGIEKYLAIKPNDSKGYTLLGEICRQRDEKEDGKKAKEYFQKAISSNPSQPEPYKGLGLMHLKEGNKNLAKKYLESYLKLSPNASDKEYIKGYLK